MDEIERLMLKAANLTYSGLLARQAGDGVVGEGYFRGALDLALEAVNRMAGSWPYTSRLEVLRAATRLALDCGEAAEARRLLDEALTADASTAYRDEWAQFRDVTSWPDEWLVAAVRKDPPDEPALDALVGRYWKGLFGRCRLLTVDPHKANDLAQETWCRVLRARHGLKPDGNFLAYLTTTATNIWRDWHRAARRAGPMAENRLVSLDAALPAEDGENLALSDVLPDLNAIREEEQRRLMLNLDQALEQLTPQLRDVLVARFLIGESCAAIGARFGRTEQTISAWVRQAIREMKRHFGAAGFGAALKDEK